MPEDPDPDPVGLYGKPLKAALSRSSLSFFSRFTLSISFSSPSAWTKAMRSGLLINPLTPPSPCPFIPPLPRLITTFLGILLFSILSQSVTVTTSSLVTPISISLSVWVSSSLPLSPSRVMSPLVRVTVPVDASSIKSRYLSVPL